MNVTGAVVAFSAILVPDINLLTYLFNFTAVCLEASSLLPVPSCLFGKLMVPPADQVPLIPLALPQADHLFTSFHLCVCVY